MKAMKTNQTISAGRIALLALLLSIATAVSAQKNIEAAFASFKNNKAVTASTSSSREADPYTGMLIQRTEVVEFSLDVGKKALIDKLRAAFDHDRDASYDEFVRTANGRTSQPILLGSEVSVGVSKNMNYIVMAFADKASADSTKAMNRTAYAMEWCKGDSNRVMGSLYVVYGPIPEKRKSSSIKVYRRELQSLPDVNNLFDMVSQKSLDDFDWKSAFKWNNGESRQGSPVIIGKGTILGGDSLATSVFSSPVSPWLYLFRTQTRGYRKALKRGNDTTYYLTSLLEHCKKDHSGLSADERRLCTDELQRLLELTKDDFDRALIEECRKLLK